MSILRTRNKNTNQWEEIQAIKGPQGPQGIQGPEGPKGDAYEITQEDYQEIANVVETDIQPTLNNKVDKASGKGLSTNDFTDTYKTRVDNNTSARHTHSNLDTINSISSTDINNWNAKADPEDIPDVSHFITKTVNDLVNYYKKTETYTKTEVNNLIGSIQQFHYEIVQTLPTTGESNILYLVPRTESEQSNIYDEYVYANNNWEKIGSTDIDLSGYVTTSDLNTALANYTTTTDLNTLLTDYVKFSDYGTTTDAGTVKSGNYGFRISNMGVGYVLRASEGNIDAKSSEYLPIVPAKLDYATKVGVTTNTIALSDSEKEKAKSWIGANFNNTVKGKDLDLTDTTASKIQEIKLFGKSSQTVNTGSNLVQYTDTNADYFFINSNVIKFGTYTEVQDNGASLYFPEGAKTYGINTRVLVKKLNLEANKWYTVTVLGGRDAGYGMNIAQYPVDAEEIYAREAVLGQGRNFTTTFKTEADKWYMLELRTPTAGEGGPRTEAFTMNIMVNEGGPKNWEPYTNGVATPTMTTPSAITNKTSENITITDGVNTQTATLNLENGGIPVSSGGNYTDENGQQYIADTIERYKDGTGKLIKRVYTQNLPNSFTKSAASGNFLLAIANLDYAPKLPSGQYAISYDILCNQFTTNETWFSQNGYIVVDGTKVSFETASDFNAYFTEHPLQYEYVLDTPIETDLTEAQLEQLDLSMYNVNTQITSDTNLEIEYIANTKQYIDNSLRELTSNRDKYTLLAETTIIEDTVTPLTWTSSGEDDMYDDIVVVAENFLGNGSSAFNIGYKLSNSTDFFTTNQSNVLNATTVRNYICETERYLPFKWKCTKRGATNAVADVTHTAIQPMTEWQDKIKEAKVYTSGTGMVFTQGTIKLYGRKRF